MPRVTHEDKVYISYDEKKEDYSVTVAYWVNGKRIRKRVGKASTKVKAERLGKEALKSIKEGQSADVKTIRGLLENYQTWLENTPINSRGFKASTKRTYVTNVDALIHYTPAKVLSTRWDKVDKDAMKTWMRALLSAKRNGKSLAQNRITKLFGAITNKERGFFLWLERQGYYDGKHEDDYYIFTKIFTDAAPAKVTGTHSDRWLTLDEWEEILAVCINSMEEKWYIYLFIDEIQNVKGFEEIVNAYREEGNYSIFLTGSNSYLLSGELVTKLIGRFIEFEMKTLTFDEYIGIKKFFGKPIDSDLEKEFLKYVIEGGFPLAVKYDSYEDKMTYVDSVIGLMNILMFKWQEQLITIIMTRMERILLKNGSAVLLNALPTDIRNI